MKIMVFSDFEFAALGAAVVVACDKIDGRESNFSAEDLERLEIPAKNLAVRIARTNGFIGVR